METLKKKDMSPIIKLSSAYDNEGTTSMLKCGKIIEDLDSTSDKINYNRVDSVGFLLPLLMK